MRLRDRGDLRIAGVIHQVRRVGIANARARGQCYIEHAARLARRTGREDRDTQPLGRGPVAGFGESRIVDPAEQHADDAALKVLQATEVVHEPPEVVAAE